MSLRLSLDMQRVVRAQHIPSDAQFKRYIRAALAPLDVPISLTIRVVGEKESQQLNHDYRHKDKPTNVLSFPFDAPPDLGKTHLGDVVICAKVVLREAKEQGKQVKHHWAHLVIHGCLHLMGYDHENDMDAQQMETMERDILAGLNIPDPYSTELKSEDSPSP